MNVDQKLATLFGMSDEVWKRHASGWSVWTRVATMPLLLLAFWAHSWIGWWSAVFVAVLVLWIWLNPRLFPAPNTTKNWAAKVTFGERIWLRRTQIEIPRDHRQLPLVLSAFAGIGFVMAIGSAIANEFWPMAVGTVLSYAGKLWFCDRMVWLYEDMKSSDPEFEGWLY